MSVENKQIIFAGTPEFAAIHLKALLDAGINITAVYTQPDRPAGRGKKPQASPVKQLARAHQIPVYQPLTFKNQEDIEQFQSLQPDLMIVVAYGLLLPPAILDTPTRGCVNVHASTLPRWRGAAPIQRAIEHGDATSGVCLMQMDVGLDTGPVLVSSEIALEPAETGGSLHDRLAACGAELLVQNIEPLFEGHLTPTNQPSEGVTYAKKLQKNEGEIDWHTHVTSIESKIRAFNPWPVCYSEIEGKKTRIWEATVISDQPLESITPGTIIASSPEGIDVACHPGVLRIYRMQLPGGRALSVRDVLNSKKALFETGKSFQMTSAS